MSWLFSRALVAAFSEASCSAGAPSAPSSSTPTPRAYLSPDRTTDFSRLSRFGMTFAPLTDDLGAELLTWFRAGFPVRTSATLGTRPASREIEADSGTPCGGSFTKYDPATSSWRTSQRCFFEGLEPFSETWPRWGSMRGGECWELPTLEARNPANASGLWPTLKASDGDQYSKNYAYFVRRQKIAPDLPVIVALNTPPTPLGYFGRINPAWAEWLMGWPTGWTAFDALATDKTLELPPKHGEC